MLSRNRILLVLISALVISTPSSSSFAADVTPAPTLSPAQQYELDLIKYKIEYRIYQLPQHVFLVMLAFIVYDHCII